MKLIAAIILFLILLNSFFYSVYCGMGIWQRKIEVKQSIRGNQYDQSLTRIAFKRTMQSEKYAVEDEINFNNYLYDIVLANTQKDSVIIYAWKDEEEQLLLNEMDNYFSEDNTCIYKTNKFNALAKQSIKPFSQPYHLPYTQNTCTLIFTTVSVNNFLVKLENHAKDIISPPPRLFA